MSDPVRLTSVAIAIAASQHLSPLDKVQSALGNRGEEDNVKCLALITCCSSKTLNAVSFEVFEDRTTRITSGMALNIASLEAQNRALNFILALGLKDRTL